MKIRLTCICCYNVLAHFSNFSGENKQCTAFALCACKYSRSNTQSMLSFRGGGERVRRARVVCSRKVARCSVVKSVISGSMTSVWGSLKVTVRSLTSTYSTVQLAKIVMMSQRSMLCHRYLLPMECTATAGKVKVA